MEPEKFVPIEPGGEVEQFLLQAVDQPIRVRTHGMSFLISRVPHDLMENYDVDRGLKGLRESAGAISPEVDVEALLEELREQRGQNSIGRPE